MHAKASIPAWIKLLAISAAAVAVIAVLIAAPWRSPARAPCDELLENIELVRSGAAERRESATRTFGSGRRGGLGLRVDEGDFEGALALDGVRSCLGSSWIEMHAAAQAADYGDAWVFSRPGEPQVLFVRSRTEEYRRVETKIVVQRGSSWTK